MIQYKYEAFFSCSKFEQKNFSSVCWKENGSKVKQWRNERDENSIPIQRNHLNSIKISYGRKLARERERKKEKLRWENEIMTLSVSQNYWVNEHTIQLGDFIRMLCSIEIEFQVELYNYMPLCICCHSLVLWVPTAANQHSRAPPCMSLNVSNWKWMRTQREQTNKRTRANKYASVALLSFGNHIRQIQHMHITNTSALLCVTISYKWKTQKNIRSLSNYKYVRRFAMENRHQFK